MLGVFSIIHGLFKGNQGYRLHYLILGIISFGAAAVDLCHPLLPIKSYEALRIIFWGAYGPAIVGLLFRSRLASALLAVIIVSIGLCICLLLDSPLATSFVIPTTFFVSAIGFACRWKRDGGYALSILTATSLSQGASSVLYLPVVLTDNQLFISLGYLHFGLVSIAGVILGWVHLPLELQGRNPVKIGGNKFLGLLLAMLLSELIILPSLAYSSIPIEGYVIGTLFQVSVLMAAFLLHRHDLLIFTDDVKKLLAKRTQSLTATKEKLKDINAEQARLLAEQASEITAKTAVIERQRRLELVAETTGQVAHDIQNIAVPMLRLTSTDRDFKHDDLEKLRYHVKELLELNDQLLALSSRRRAKLRPILVEDVIRAATSWLSDDELRLFEINCTEGAWVNGMDSQLTRAVGNLAKNALDAVNRDSGKVRITSREINVAEPRRCFLGNLPPGMYVQIEVSDNGHGIPTAIREKIFDPYFSAKPNGKAGTGLGLTIVSSIVRDHGGVVDLRSDEFGTCFEILIPAIHPQTTDGCEGRPTQNRTVAVLDYSSQSCKMIKEWLSECGLSFQMFDSLTELYHSASRDKFRLILISRDGANLPMSEIVFAVKNLSPRTEVKFFTVATDAESPQSSIKSERSNEVLTSRTDLIALLNSNQAAFTEEAITHVH
jgi:signal transduction histidine kinase